MNRTLKIFLSCASGAGIGAFVALQLNQYLWWIGMLVGGLVGYFSYEFKAVLQAIPKAYKRAKGLMPDKEFILSVVYLILFFVSWIFPLLALATFWPRIYARAHFFPILTLAWLTSMTFSLAYVSFTIVSLSKSKKYDKMSERGKALFYFGNPVSFAFYLLLKEIFQCIIRIPNFLCFMGRFIKQAFLLIHSDIRLLCGIDAAIGAGVGYFAGNAIVGAVAGGIFGVINYKIISQKILKLHFKTNH